jgi:hypothetical protein
MQLDREALVSRRECRRGGNELILARILGQLRQRHCQPINARTPESLLEKRPENTIRRQSGDQRHGIGE